MLQDSQVRSATARARLDAAKTTNEWSRVPLSLRLVRQQSAANADTVPTELMAELSSLGVKPEVRWSCRIQPSRTYMCLPIMHALALRHSASAFR